MQVTNRYIMVYVICMIPNQPSIIPKGHDQRTDPPHTSFLYPRMSMFFSATGRVQRRIIDTWVMRRFKDQLIRGHLFVFAAEHTAV